MSQATDISLKEFVCQHDSNFDLQAVDLHLKESLLGKCLNELRNSKSTEILNALSCIRILTRDEESLDKIASETYLERIFLYAFPDEDLKEDLAVEALKSLSNLIFKRRSVIPYLRSAGIEDKLLRRLKQHAASSSRSDVLLIDLKVFFILTGTEPETRSEFAKNEQAFPVFADLLNTFRSTSFSETDAKLIAEALRAAYNVGYAIHHDDKLVQFHRPNFYRFVHIFRGFLIRPSVSESVHLQITSQIVNFLNVIPRRCFCKLLFSDETSSGAKSEAFRDKPVTSQPSNAVLEMKAVDVLLAFLDKQLSGMPSAVDKPAARIDESLCPILNVLIKASQGNRKIRRYCRGKILPKLGEDVKRLPEEGTTLRNRLCKLLTHPVQNVSEMVALLVFVLCKEDIGRAIKYTGFGNFAGFLARHSLLGRSEKKRTRVKEDKAVAAGNLTKTAQSEDDSDSVDDYSSASSESNTEEYDRLKNNVNPVTGRYEEPHSNPLEEMTEEQKEQIVMDLVRDIDKLQRSGVIRPGKVEDGRVRPVEHVLELLDDKEKSESEKSSGNSD